VPKTDRKPITILMCDDDDDDRMLAKKALRDSRLANDMRFAVDGEDLLRYLRRKPPYAAALDAPRPGIILLDLNMPKMDGREALSEIKADPELRHIPIVVLTTSRADEDIFRTYDLGVNSFITKPVTFEGLAEVMNTLSRYWFEIVDLPQEGDGEFA
jgi:CheY-like chemotaxis protein